MKILTAHQTRARKFRTLAIPFSLQNNYPPTVCSPHPPVFVPTALFTSRIVEESVSVARNECHTSLSAGAVN